MKFDLHVHSNLSYDSKMTVDELVSAAKKAGLSGVAIADHNVFRKHTGQDDFYFIPACEYSTDIGHLIVYFLKEHINESLSRDEYGRFYWRDICKVAHDQGAVVFYAHPFAPEKEHSKSLYSQIDGIEVFNSRSVFSFRNANKLALKLCKELGKPFSAGSNAHSPIEVGVTYWECNLPENSMSEPDFEEKLKAELLSSNGKIFSGVASRLAVLRSKRYLYRTQGLWGKYIGCIFSSLIAYLKYPFAKKYKAGYIELDSEAEI